MVRKAKEDVRERYMSEFFDHGTNTGKFYQFPEFLLQIPISQTAKLAYMLLYDRARLSRKNNRIKNSHIYVNYTIKSMADALGKSETTVKNIYKELDEVGLLIRMSGGFSKPNDLYVLIPDSRQFSDLMRKQSVVRKENNPFDGQESIPATGSKLASNKVIEINNKSNNKGVNQPVPYGKYKNIYLSKDEYDQLKMEFPYRIHELIEEMSSYLAANGKEYQNYEAALRSWAAREKDNNSRTNPNAGFPDYSYKPGESY